MKKVKLILLVGVICLLASHSLVYGQGTPHYRGVNISQLVTASDLQYLGETWHVNMIRWPLHWQGSTPLTAATPAQYDAWLETTLEKLDSLLPVCQKNGIKVLLDLHDTPGGTNAAGDRMILRDASQQAEFLKVWNKMAARYAGNPTIWGYDLANEPNGHNLPSGVMTWTQLATRAALNIRAIDADHTIVVEPTGFGAAAGFKGFVPLPSSIPNVVYSFHMYDPWSFASQGIGSNNRVLRYPGVIDKVMWDKQQLMRDMQPVFDFQKKYGVPIFVGEFSAVRWAAGGSAYNWLKDVIPIFEANGWDWTYFAFREYNGWSVEHTEDKKNQAPATKQTNRERLLRSYFNKNL